MLLLNRPMHHLRPPVNNHPRLQMVLLRLQMITALSVLIPLIKKLLLPIGMLFQYTPLSSTDWAVLYRAAYGYDVNSSEFKDWAAGLQNQYAQYYAGQGQPGEAASGYTPSAPGSAPPPPPPNSEVPPPPPA